MLVIRKEQMAVLSQYMLDRDIKCLADYVLSEFPEVTRPWQRDKLENVVAQCIEKASNYNIVLEKNVKRLLSYYVRLGPGFGDKPDTLWAHPILSNNNIDETTKMNRLDQAWDNAQDL